MAALRSLVMPVCFLILSTVASAVAPPAVSFKPTPSEYTPFVDWPDPVASTSSETPTINRVIFSTPILGWVGSPTFTACWTDGTYTTHRYENMQVVLWFMRPTVARVDLKAPYTAVVESDLRYILKPD